MSDRFDFEQQIVKCWNITDDLGELSEGFIDHGVSFEDISTTLIGLKNMYDLKFNKLWELFEDVHMNLVREHKMIEEECIALRNQLKESE